MDRRIVVLALGALLSSCAGVEFGNGEAFDGKGLVFFDPIPYLFVSVTPDCSSTSAILALPGSERRVKIKSGYGSSETSLAFAGGLLTNVGQKTDNKIPELLTAVAALPPAFGSKAGDEKKAPCEATATLYPIVNGVLQIDKSVNVPVTRTK